MVLQCGEHGVRQAPDPGLHRGPIRDHACDMAPDRLFDGARDQRHRRRLARARGNEQVEVGLAQVGLAVGPGDRRIDFGEDSPCPRQRRDEVLPCHSEAIAASFVGRGHLQHQNVYPDRSVTKPVRHLRVVERQEIQNA
jgi:hypothetical protein